MNYFFPEMKRQILLIFLTSTIILVCQAANGFVKNQDKVVTVKTLSGSFPLPIPILRLPKIQEVPLVSVSDVVLPELPDWYYSRFIPKDPSWLDSAGKFYKEGLVY